ncbi:DUF805 domain-containing protein [Aliidiomarina halalkaliphila]|uniref:DUF805 domain-containing protein n=1 Tax=Aliidiomarina halalkaliphila TaxID=2593535 RepID=A0A552X5W0_9GAMM|nr:DUF805 domain-containing protein [Aliidiomarina halalkaliphila]TRW50380.1 DUF805 domain-containing protein [Aliidiomarina halalkaliphila]
MNWYLEVFRKYTVFTGRSRRAEYWWFILINMIIAFILGFIDGFSGTFNEQFGLGLLSGIYMLVILIPSIAVAIRRLHDTGRSGWWMLILFVPLIGGLVFLVFMLLPSEAGENKWGPNPIEQGAQPA